jgi:DNA-binding transcriptional ArsR family regulator
METRRDAFQAIADPTRRQIIDLLSTRSMNLNAIADEFDVSRPAISKHIKILYQCGLIQITEKGRERHCRANLAKLKEVSEWVERYRTFWNRRLDMLGEFLEKDINKDI